MYLKICLPALAVITLGADVAWAEEDLCEYPKCKPEKYLAIWDAPPPAPLADCRTGSKTCELRTLPPPDAYVECYYQFASYACEAWPQGPELSFQWSSSGFLAAPSPTTGAYSGVSCLEINGRGGTISVTVTGPGGSRTAWTSVSCRQEIER